MVTKTYCDRCGSTHVTVRSVNFRIESEKDYLFDECFDLCGSCQSAAIRDLRSFLETLPNVVEDK